MHLKAYQQAANRSEGPRETEYRLFGEVTRALMHAATLPDSEFRARIDALDWNRQVWMTMAQDCVRPSNQLDPALRAQIVSLSMWVSRHSAAVIQGVEAIEPLIEVNRAVMQGLAARSVAAA